MKVREARDSPVQLKADMAVDQALADRLGLYVQAYTLYSSVRPFGISSMLGGIDKQGPQLYVVEPSGVFYVGQVLGSHQPTRKLRLCSALSWCSYWQGPPARENRTREA